MLKLLNLEWKRTRIIRNAVIFILILCNILRFIGGNFSDQLGDVVGNAGFGLTRIITFFGYLMFSYMIVYTLRKDLYTEKGNFVFSTPEKKWKIYISKLLAGFIYYAIGLIIVVLLQLGLSKIFSTELSLEYFGKIYNNDLSSVFNPSFILFYVFLINLLLTSIIITKVIIIRKDNWIWIIIAMILLSIFNTSQMILGLPIIIAYTVVNIVLIAISSYLIEEKVEI